MQNLSYLVQEMMMEQREFELSSSALRMRMEAQATLPDGGGARRALAGGLVRLGLRLDPAAGEGLGASRLELAGHRGVGR